MNIIPKNVRIYFAIALVAILSGCYFLMVSEKVEGHLFVNARHAPFFDFFFTYFTHVGGGTFVIVGSILLSILFWKKYRFGIVVLSSINLLLVAGVTQFLKHFIYADATRPIEFIVSKLLHTAPGVEMHTSNSFPSGHTAAGFAFFALVSFLYGKNKWIQLICAGAAILVGFSRIYLSQHFLEDTVLGGSIGLLCFLVSYWLVKKQLILENIS